MAIKNILIAGGGHFGRKSISYAQKNKYRILVIDNDPTCFAASLANATYINLENLLRNFEAFSSGDIIFLNDDISITFQVLESFQFEHIIPVVPVHLIAQIVKDFLKNNGFELIINESLTRRVAERLDQGLLLNQVESKGVIYLSYAKQNEICPDNCSSPLDYCPNHKRGKPITITDYLKKTFRTNKTFNIDPKDEMIYIIMNSIQLEAGLGGLKGSEINALFSKILNNLKKVKNQKSHYQLIISTSCNCHGVMNFYEIEPMN